LFLDAKEFGNVSHPQEDYQNWAEMGYGTRLSRKLEIDITSHCDLKCHNCDRSCRQAPTENYMTVQQISAFVRDSLSYTKTKPWDLIKLTGGEPSCHPELRKVIEPFLRYKQAYPTLKMWYNTHGCGQRAQESMGLARSCPWINHVNSSSKTGPIVPTHDSYNKAPVDYGLPGAVCPRPWDCGMSLTYYGIYPCGPGAAIARVFGLDIAIQSMSALTHEAILEQLEVLCPLCGHSPTDIKEYNIGAKEVVSSSWEKAYNDYREKPPKMRRIYDRLPQFKGVWSSKKRQAAIDMLAAIDEVFSLHGVGWMLIYGTLLGCIRHGGQIPWDDDMDITINKNAAGGFADALDDLHERGYSWAEEDSPQNGHYLKMFPKTGEQERYYRKPFVDIFSYVETEDKIDFCSNGQTPPPLKPFSKTDILPLVRRDFWGLSLPTPNKSSVFLDRHYPGWDKQCVNFKRNRYSLSNLSMSIDELRPFHEFKI